MDAERPTSDESRGAKLAASEREHGAGQKPGSTPTLSPAAPNRIALDSRQLTPADVLSLQRLVGNSAVARLLQAKRTATQLGDPLEQEAERAAEQAIGSLAPDGGPPGPAEETNERLSADPQSPARGVQLSPSGGSTAAPGTPGAATQAPSAAAEPANLTRLRQLLDDGEEDQAIALMGRLGPGEAQLVLQNSEFQRLAVSAFDNDEMYRAVRAMRTNLPLSLKWMFDEGTDWSKVRDVIRRIPEGRDRVLSENTLRDEFVGLCDNEEMAEAVQLLEGALRLKLWWMLAEGTDGTLVTRVVSRAHNDYAQLAEVSGDPLLMRALESELSSNEYRWLQGVLSQGAGMLGHGVLAGEAVNHRSSERHYERENATSPWELETFGWTTKYDIYYTRTQLRIAVKIKLTGETAPDDKRALWLNGIRNRWNGHFHIEDGRTLGVSFEPAFVESGEHHRVRVHAGPGRADAANWYLGDSIGGDTAAHEFGHLVGLEDEYRLTAADYRRVVETAPPPGPTPPQGYTNPGLMTSGQGPVQGRHLRPFLAWLNTHRLPGEPPYLLVSGGS